MSSPRRISEMFSRSLLGRPPALSTEDTKQPQPGGPSPTARRKTSRQRASRPCAQEGASSQGCRSCGLGCATSQQGTLGGALLRASLSRTWDGLEGPADRGRNTMLHVRLAPQGRARAYCGGSTTGTRVNDGCRRSWTSRTGATHLPSPREPTARPSATLMSFPTQSCPGPR